MNASSARAMTSTMAFPIAMMSRVVPVTRGSVCWVELCWVERQRVAHDPGAGNRHPGGKPLSGAA
jgi:hypothetical protein